MTKWEYCYILVDYKYLVSEINGKKERYAKSTAYDKINELGQDGWEMVNAMPDEGAYQFNYIAIFFKRPLP